MHEIELKRLALNIREGDEKSFRLLVETLSRSLVALGYRYTRDWEWARDLTQETWIKVYQNIERWDSDQSFSAWLHTIHRNGCLDHLRRGWVRRESTPGDEVILGLKGSDPHGPEEELERQEFHRHLMEALTHLSESQRQIFLRVDIEQGDQKTVAQKLGIKPGTLRATLHFARKRLATVLQERESTA